MQERTLAEDKFTIDALLKRAYMHRSSQEYVQFVSFIKRFHHYSRFNTMLVYAQNRAVTFFGGTSFWRKKFGRGIMEDARPYVIISPGGPVMMVYDIFETIGEKSPEELLERGLGSKPFEVKGSFNDHNLQLAFSEAIKMGIQVKHRPLSYFNAGYVTTIFAERLEINIKEDLGPAEQFSTLLHELAHLFLGHTGHEELMQEGRKAPLKLPQRRNLSRAAEELEAETVCYLILDKLGLESRSAEYLAGHIHDENILLEVNYEVIIKTADKVEKLFISKA